MNRQQKVFVVQDLQKKFSDSQASFLVDYKGLTVAQMQALRRDLGNNGGRLQIAKVRLIKRAIEGASDTKKLTPYLKGQIGLVFVLQESTTVAKILYEFSKKNNALEVLAGCLDSQLFNKDEFIRIANLPSREVLLGQVCGTIKAPITNCVSVLKILLLRLMWTLKQVEKKRS